MIRKLKPFSRFAAVRALSSVVTISLFGVFARRLNDQDLENALSFSLIFGFFAALARMLPSFAAKVQPDYNSKQRQTAVLLGYKSVLSAQIFLAPMFFIISRETTLDLDITIYASIILIVCSVDFDLIRAAKGKEMVFPPLFLGGSAISLTYFSSVGHPTGQDAFIATIIQWLPVALFSVFCILKIKIGRILSMPLNSMHLISSLLIVSFDGLILNLPMMKFIPLDTEVRIEAAVLIRSFTSSLVFFPYFIFVTNKTPRSQRNANPAAQRWIFFSLLFASSVIMCMIYVIYFRLVSGSSLSLISVATLAPLSLGFSLYYACARFISVTEQSSPLFVASIISASTLYTVIFLIFRLETDHVILAQAIAFGAMSIVTLSAFRLRSSTQEQGN